jgi:4-amino-4-deoxy-L-arabinose transferase-like glycosyltransferase
VNPPPANSPLRRKFSSSVSDGRLGILLVSALALALALFHTTEIPLIDRDEGRYAEAAREILASGDWLVPRVFGVPYLEKPPLFYWLTAVACRLVGVDELGARLVSALAAAFGVLATGLFARRMFGPRAGLASAAILATSGLYFVLARVAVTDMLFSVLVAGSLLTYFLAETEGRSYAPFWLLAAAATLTKGPVAPVLCGLVALGHLAVRGSWQSLRVRRFWVGLLLYLMVVLPWFALIELRYPSFLHFYVYKEHVLRVAGDEHREAFYWYLPWLLAGFLPWTPVLLAALPAIRRRTEEDSPAGAAARFAVIWAVIVFVFFSVPRGKLAPYILPVFPALAILLGAALARVMDAAAVTGRAMPRAFGFVGAALLLAPVGLPIGLRLSPVAISPGLVAVAVAVALAAGAATLRSARRKDWQPLAAVAGSIAALQCIAAVVAAPITQYFTARPVVEILRGQLGPDDQVALYTGYFPSMLFYLQRIPYFVFGYRELDFGISLEGRGLWIVDNLHELEQRVGRRRLFVVLRTNENDFRELRKMPRETRVLYRGRRSSLVESRP